MAQAFILGEEFIGDDTVCLVSGDNIFYGPGLIPIVKKASELKNGVIVFGLLGFSSMLIAFLFLSNSKTPFWQQSGVFVWSVCYL